MDPIATALFLAAAQTLTAPSPSDAAATLALADFASHCGSSARLWGKPLCGPVVIVDRDTRRAVANTRPADPTFRRIGNVWVGTLPRDLGLANTSVEWGGRRWAEVLLPLPQDPDERRVLLVHEAFHRIQPELGFPASEADNGHLDSKDGRIYARLELAALKAALVAVRAGREWRQSAQDALAYRQARIAIFPDAARTEGNLLANEGLAEYTGIRVAAPLRRTHLAISRLDTATGRGSLIRSFGYVVGPAYGLLLDRVGKPWRRAALDGKALPAILSASLGMSGSTAPDLVSYDAPAIIAQENERAETIRRRTEALTTSLVTGPVVTFRFERMKIEFDPDSLFALGEEGTVYTRSTTIRDSWGELRASGNVLISPSWKFARVPGPATQHGSTVNGPGWTAILAPGYAIIGGERPNEQLIELRP